MKNSIFIFLSIFISFTAYSQADLVITSADFDPSSIDKGEIFFVQATVSNIGTSVAPANYLFVYFTQDLSVSAEEIISRVSVKELAPGESQDISFIYPIPTPLSSGNYYLAFEIDPFDDVTESDEGNIFCASDGPDCSTFNITNTIQNYQKYTYPVIFVHGWASNSETWDMFTDESALNYGWSYGGRLDYCLNPDGDQSTSNYPALAWSFIDDSNLYVGDYYTVNFDINKEGDIFVTNDLIPFNDDESNQSAIFKQGLAVGDAVQKVLNKTGAEKVILVGHSMGGLASRQYLQDSNLWQSDGEHHVAKLLTIGTPNGGSNISVGNIGGLILNLDENSEAVRDLRYGSVNFGGQFLDGGFESSLTDFYNDDINCNGTIGDNIVGLNEKTAPSDVNYSCIVGIGDNLPSSSGDGIVDADRADLNNYLLAQSPAAPLFADRFDVTSGHTSIHTENHSTLIQGLDESQEYTAPYLVPLNTLNFAHSTIPANNSPYGTEIDWDDYQIEITEPGTLEVDIWNIPVHGFSLYLYNESFDVLQNIQAEGESNIGFTYDITPGTYILETGSIPTTNSYRFPYGYSIIFTPDTGLAVDFTVSTQTGCAPMTVIFSDETVGNAVSYSWVLEGATPSTSVVPNPLVVYETPGTYPVSLTVTNSGGSTTTTKNGYMTVKTTAEAEFSLDIESDNIVAFTNQTQYDNEVPEYTWDFGDGQGSNSIAPTHEYENPGTYDVTLTATNLCGETTDVNTVEILPVSTVDVKAKSEISVYPNPTNVGLNIKIAGEFEGSYEILLFNGTGQLLKKKSHVKQGLVTITDIDIFDLPKGSYFVQIVSEQDTQVRKVVKN